MVTQSLVSSPLHLLCCFQPVEVSRYYAPLFVLTPEQLATAQPTMVLGGASWLLSSEEEVLFCSYCVSSSKKWLLATCSNKHGEILNTSVIEIHTAKQVYPHVHVQMKQLLYPLYRLPDLHFVSQQILLLLQSVTCSSEAVAVLHVCGRWEHSALECGDHKGRQSRMGRDCR